MKYLNKPRIALAVTGWVAWVIAGCLLVGVTVQPDPTAVLAAAQFFGLLGTIALVGQLVAHSVSYDAWYRGAEGIATRKAASEREAQRTPPGRNHYEGE